MKPTNEIEVAKTLGLLRAYWDGNAPPAERVEMLRAAGEFDRDLRFMRHEEVEALAASPFAALSPRMLLALALAHLNEIEEMEDDLADAEVEAAEKRAGWSTTP